MRRYLTIKSAVVVLVLSAAVLSGVLDARLVLQRKAELGQLLWNDDEAFLLIDEALYGWRVDAGLLRKSLVPASVGFAPPPQLSRFTLLACRITSQSEEARSLRVASPLRTIKALGHDLYLTIDGVPMRWGPQRLELVDREEWQQLKADDVSGSYFRDVKGWSSAGHIIAGDNKYWLTLSGQRVDIVTSGDGVARTRAIDIQRAGASRKRIWSIDENYRRVSAEDYSAAFKE